jgi:hypothetical protein
MTSPAGQIRQFVRDHGIYAPIQLLTEADRRLSGRLVGNPAGFMEQFLGAVVRSYYRLRAPAPAGIRERGREIRRNGVAILGQVLPKTTVDSLLAMFERRLASDPDSVRRMAVADTTVYEGFKLNHADRDLDLVKTAMVPEVIDALCAATGTGFQVISYDIWRNHALPEGQNDVYSNRWHADGQRVDQFKVFFFLHETSDQHGGSIIADRHETRAIFSSGYRSRKTYGTGQTMLASIERRGIMKGPAGFAYVFNPNTCLHRAGVPDAGFSRSVLMVTVVSAPRVDLNPKDPRRF